MDPNNTINHRYDIVVIVDALDSNGNGDPDGNGAPRIDPVTGEARISAWAQHRKYRDAVGARYNFEPPNDILMRNHDTQWSEDGERIYINEQIQRALPEDGRTEKKGKKNTKYTDVDKKHMIASRYFDVPSFGLLASVGDDRMGTIRGAVSTYTGRSVHTVMLNRDVCTRAMLTHDGEKRGEQGGGTMGGRIVALYAAYKLSSTVNPQRAQKSGFTSQHLMTYIQAIVDGYQLDQSSGRCLVLRDLYVFRQPPLGRAPLGKMWSELVEVKCKVPDEEARSIDHFDIKLRTDLVPAGVDVFRLGQIYEMLESETSLEDV